jgi:hypothetical protein
MRILEVKCEINNMRRFFWSIGKQLLKDSKFSSFWCMALSRHPQIGLGLNIFNVLKNQTERNEEKGEKSMVKLRTLHTVNKFFSIIFPHFLAKQTENNNFVRNVVLTNDANG